MRKKIFTISTITTVALLLTMLVAASVAVAGDKSGAPRVTTLSGAEEVNGGDPDGSGFASIRLNVGQERVCWEIEWADINGAAAAHIHRAPKGANGGVVVPLDPNTPGCAEEVDPVLIQEIIDFPERFYVNVHNAEFPGGALRGQLSNRGQSK